MAVPVLVVVDLIRGGLFIYSWWSICLMVYLFMKGSRTRTLPCPTRSTQGFGFSIYDSSLRVEPRGQGPYRSTSLIINT